MAQREKAAADARRAVEEHDRLKEAVRRGPRPLLWSGGSGESGCDPRRVDWPWHHVITREVFERGAGVFVHRVHGEVRSALAERRAAEEERRRAERSAKDAEGSAAALAARTRAAEEARAKLEAAR